MKISILLALSLLALPLAGCAVDADGGLEDLDVVEEADFGLTASQGISVQASYREVITGTPTYGYPATSPVLTVRITVDDAALKGQFPSFDGMESAFVMVPFQKNGSVVWESRRLTWTGTTLAGYHGQTRLDVHESGSIWGVDWATLSANGVAVGLDANVGTIWAQGPGQNWQVVKN
ncbi:MAG TPA: hypothetical protein VLS89_18065 [Candidatus Nanopelagicales bacterium]|nr:hypothetical protein [Candidatus Nanopelagicales bacterium]